MINFDQELGTVETHEPTLQSSCMLVELNISVWEGVKTDARAGKQVGSLNNAKERAIRVQKNLLDGCAELDAIKTIRGQAREYHRAHTLPWSNSGLHLLTTMEYLDSYHRTMTDYSNKFYAAVDVFLQVYSMEISKAHATLGDLFNTAEYPTVDQIRGKFGLYLTYMPLPESGDFRIDIQAETKTALVKSYDKFYKTQLASAMGEVWQRLLKPLQNMSLRLDYKDGERPSGFKDTLVSNVAEMAEILRTCNITNDPQMEQVRQELVRTLRGVTPDNLRNSQSLRKRTKEDIDKIIGSIPSMSDFGA